MNERPIRVLVVDDSALMRALVSDMLLSAEFDVVGAAPNPLIARQMIKDLTPDVVTLDVEMPKMDGLSFLEKIMTLRPMPVVMVSSLTQAGTDATLRALELGAVDYFAKPSGDLREGMQARATELAEKVRAAASARVRARAPSPPTPTPTRALAFDASEMIVAVGASTGGVEALGRLIGGLPADAPGMVVAQHMPANFTRQFAERLDRSCAMRVAEAEDGRRVMPGCVFIAPGGRHLRVRRSGADFVCAVGDDAPVNRHRPSVDVLLQSVAESCGARAVGVILTGMGRDGAEGLLAMRRAGAATLGQDERTSLVYGMPRAAFEVGAVERQVADDAVAEAVLDIARRRNRAMRT